MRLTTWNILHGRSLDDGQVDAERLRIAAAGLGADVLAVQEVDRAQDRSGGRDQAADVAVAVGAPAGRFVPALIGSPDGRWRAADEADDLVGAATAGAYGVALVSRYPVLAWHTLRMPPAAVWAPVLVPGTRRVRWLRDEPRVALAAVVQAPQVTMTVVSAHLSFVPGQNLLQLRRLARWLEALPGPQVLLGDLNMPSRLAALVSGFEVLARHATYPAPRPRRQVDHVLGHGALPPVRTSSVRASPVSDHFALSVDL